MYGASLVFLAMAIGSLLLASRSGGLTLVFVSIGCSVMSALFLAVSVLRGAAEAPEPAAEPSDWTGGATVAAGAPAEREPPAGQPGTRAAQVVAIPKRGIYHAPTCRHVAGRRDAERMTVAAAKRRGFSACGVCRPG